jgi:hypothetical protein
MPLFVPLEVYRSGGLAQVNLDRVDYIRPVSDGVSAIFFSTTTSWRSPSQFHASLR